MPISRRHFLRTGAIAFAAAGAPLSLSALAAEGRPPNKSTAQPDTKSALMSKATFAPLLNTVFFIRPADGEEIPVELIAVQDSAPARRRKLNARAAGHECFALLFSASTHQTLAQNTYRLEHRTLGQFDLFIGPLQSNKRGQVYEAIINHQRA
jgi:hypothetical protein